MIPPKLGAHFDAAGLSRLVARRQETLARTIDLRQIGAAQAHAYISANEGKLIMDEIRRQVRDIEGAVEAENGRLGQRLNFSLTFIAPAIALLTLVMLVLAVVQTRAMRRTLTVAQEAERQAERRGEQLAALTEMADELHAAADREETYRIISHHGARLLPDGVVELFVYNHSRDQLRQATSWGGTVNDSDTMFPPADCWAIRKGKPQINHVGRSVRCDHLPETGGALCVPITARGQTVGLLTISGGETGALEADGEIRRTAITLSEQVALALVNLDLRERLENQALRDTLTNLYNRRYLEEASERELNRADRLGTTLSIIAIDIDHFKRFNDQHGHAAGDEVLKRVSGYLMEGCRATDLVCRLGGEELLIMLPDTDLEGALAMAEKLRDDVSHVRIRWHSGELPPVTVSMGIAAYPQHARKFAVLHSLADEALYRAKQGGRNRVCVWTPRNRSADADSAAVSQSEKAP